MLKPITDADTDTLHKRILSLMAVAVDLGFDFLHLSSLGKATKILVDQGVARIVKILDGKIREMSEEEILTQVLYVRDEIIPYLLGEAVKPKEEQHAPEDQDTR